MNYTSFTSESVTSGHPDKICDQVSDSIVDAAIEAYPKSRVGIETLVTTNRVVMAGEVTCPKKLDYENIARKVIKNLGYNNCIFNFSHQSPIFVFIHAQSPDIALGVDNEGAGDQGMMFGYATSETPQLMPLPIILAHKIVEVLDNARVSKKIPYLRPDGKSEVKVRYRNGKPQNVERIILAVPHDPKITNEQLKEELIKFIIKPILKKFKLQSPLQEEIVINGTGRWEIGGPSSDTGVTGRKIIVDTYGGMGRHGGGCFSGKDPTKVDRSGAYACRFIAKNIVAAKLASRCEVQIAYVIGHKEPITKSIETFGTNTQDLKKVEKFAWNLLDLSVWGIIKTFDLLRPIYRETACYGHFGREKFPWEEIVS